MVKLAWHYKFHAIRLLTVQLILLAVIISTLGLTGLGIDIIHKGFNPEAKAPNYPFSITPPTTWSALQTVATLAGIILTLALFRFMLERFVTVWKSLLVQTMVVDLRAAVYDKLQRLSFRFFDANESGSIINRVTSDVQGLRTFVDGVLLEFIVIILSLIAYIAFMLQLHIGLTFACLASTPIIYLLVVVFSRIVRPAYRENRRLFDSAVRVLSENVQGVHVVKGFGLQPQQTKTFSKANDDVANHKNFIFKNVSTFIPIISFLPTLNIAVLLIYGSYIFIHNPTFTIGHLLIFAGLLHQFSEKIHSISQIANGMQRALTSAQRVFEIQDTPIEIESPDASTSLERAKGKITFKNTTFSYTTDPDAPPVLNRINFTAEPGQCIAVLGATGSGKSTLLSLIPRFYDPTQGTVLIDDTDLRNYDLFDLRRNIGIVFQESFLFSHSIAENIAFGHPEATREQIEEAAKIAQAHDFITNLENGYDTPLKEGGNNLSGGQKQRLAIARALLLQPPILLLDDPTAAIDPETEHEILSAMDAAMQGRTTFVIAHRLSTLRRADHIIVLDNGEIVEQGTHTELMEHGGHYRTAADLQIADPHSRQILGLTT
ncbi:ABC transporter ATP-binding protein [Planctomycetota bacterium]|nr:ABC transporter ATP-binding protein [Planctomycetota bacterium]